MEKKKTSRKHKKELTVIEINKPTEEQARLKIKEISKIINLIYGGE